MRGHYLRVKNGRGIGNSSAAADMRRENRHRRYQQQRLAGAPNQITVAPLMPRQQPPQPAPQPLQPLAEAPENHDMDDRIDFDHHFEFEPAGPDDGPMPEPNGPLAVALQLVELDQPDDDDDLLDLIQDELADAARTDDEDADQEQENANGSFNLLSGINLIHTAHLIDDNALYGFIGYDRNPGAVRATAAGVGPILWKREIGPLADAELGRTPADPCMECGIAAASFGCGRCGPSLKMCTPCWYLMHQKYGLLHAPTRLSSGKPTEFALPPPERILLNRHSQCRTCQPRTIQVDVISAGLGASLSFNGMIEL